MEIIKQPWLSKDEIFDGKPKNVQLEANNQKFSVNRETRETTFESENTDLSQDTFKTPDAELMIDILADLNSHLVVTIGDVQLKSEDADKYLKLFREYQKKKEARLKRDVENQLRLSAEKNKRLKKLKTIQEKLPNKAKKRLLEQIPRAQSPKLETPTKKSKLELPTKLEKITESPKLETPTKKSKSELKIKLEKRAESPRLETPPRKAKLELPASPSQSKSDPKPSNPGTTVQDISNETCPLCKKVTMKNEITI